MQKSTEHPPHPARLDWDDVRYFLALAEHGSLSAAARALAVEHTTVARRIGALERQLARHLFDRLPQAWRLTLEGEALLAHARRLEEEALAFLQAARSQDATAGVVRLSAPPVFASRFLVPRLAPRLRELPALQLQLVGEARSADLVRREADIALRLGRPADPRLAGRPLAELGYGLYGDPAWQRQDAAGWRFLRFGEDGDDSAPARWLREFAGGRAFAFASNDLLALGEAARAGLGLALLPHFLARTLPGLVQLADCPIRRPLWLALHPDVRRSPRVARASALVAEVVTAAAAALE